MKNILIKYLMSIVVAFFLGFIAYWIAPYIHGYFSETGIRISQICSLISSFLSTVALFGLAGSEIQTWRGNTGPEWLNSILYKCILSLAYFLMTLSICIELVGKN